MSWFLKFRNYNCTLHILLSLFLGLSFVLYIRYGEVETTSALTEEDSIVESLSALFYLLGFLISLISLFKNKKKCPAIVWALLCLLFFGEETSWMQRVFWYSVPAVEKINVQSEFNIHNLKIFEDGRLFDLLYGFDREKLLKVLLNSEVLFQIGFWSYFIMVPILLSISKINLLMSRIGYPKTDISFTYTILVVIMLSFFLTLNCPPEVRPNVAETREMLYAYFIMMYTGLYILSPRKAHARIVKQIRAPKR